MKKYLQNFKFFTLALGLMLTASIANAANRFSVANGNWNATTTWAATSGGAPGATVPVAGDVVTIEGGFNVTVTAAATCATINIVAGSTLTRGTQNITCTGLTISGVSDNGNGGSFTVNGNVSGAGTITAGATPRVFNVTGNWTFSGTITAGDEIQVVMNGTGNQTISGVISNGADPGVLTINKTTGTVTLGSNINTGGGTFTLTAGTFDPATFLLTATTRNFTAGTLRVGAATFAGNYSGAITQPAAGIIEYYAAGAQTVNAITYPGTLVLSGSGAKTLTGTTINATLSIQGTATTTGTSPTYGGAAILEYNGSAAQTTGATEFPATLNADLVIDNAAGVTLGAGAKTLNGNLTLTSGTLAATTLLSMSTTGTPLITVDGGNITGTLQGTFDYDVAYIGNSKTTGPELNNGGLANVDINLTTGQTLTLDANRTPDGTIDVVEGIFDLSTFTFNRSAAGGSFNINDGGWLKIGGTNSFPTNYGASTIGNVDATVEYNGTAQTAATLPTDAYTILILSGSGAKTLTAETVNELLSIQGTATTTGVAPTYLDAATILEYKGSGAQTTSNIEFSGTGGTNPTNLRIDNTAGVTLLAAKTINGALTLTNGYLTTTTGTLLSIGTGGSATTANGAFVNGPLAKLKNTTTLFTFPVGNLTGGLRTIGVTPSGTGAATYQASFLSTDPRTVPLGNVLGGTPLITQISACEYWDLARTGGTTTARVTVSWPAVGNTCGSTNWGAYVGQVSSLVVGHHDGVSWKNEGQFSTTGSAAAGGTITSTTFLATFSPFVLATTSSLNALPVTFDDVKAFEKGTGVQIEWSNLTEKDVLNYVVERSANGRDFTAISQLASRSNLSDKQSYLSFDGSPLSGTNYYRIKVVEIDGKVIYSKVLKVDIGRNVKGIILYPNPVTGSDISIGFTAVKGQYTLRVVNNAGQEVYTKQIVHPGGSISQTVTLPSALKTGVYNLMISGDNYRENKMFIMQ